jgi:hypothetical protein
VDVHGQLAFDEVAGGSWWTIGAVGAAQVGGVTVDGGVVGDGDDGAGADGAVVVVVVGSVTDAEGRLSARDAGRTLALDAVTDWAAMPTPSPTAARTLAAPAIARALAAGRRRGDRARVRGFGRRFMSPVCGRAGQPGPKGL